ncbi:hypothetical protein J4050_05050 [Winogradskyella sp. DF17]|jgi:hypothetical protein|uniref:Uncharacterized protein n=1 Tax=Winogradskyella pelagia TaxID=2819984 RepID=A0ABS3T033_9FLAO|nr:DUF6090 family protein [Winogradskyella sp. DF17]MBO3116102.1 hypothetical protein [Winogradskyella sp. DF17]
MKNKTSKYFKYAIGEILLVVVGILIALQINNWNLENQNNKQEKEILNLLLSEYENNLNQINQKIDIRNDVLKSCYILLKYRKEPESFAIVDSLDRHLIRITLRPTFDPELSVTNELINTGKLYLLHNKELRNNVSSFSSSLSELQEEEVIIVDFTENQVMPFLRENYQIGRMHMEIFDDKKMREKITMGSMANYDTLKSLFEKSDFKPLLVHPDFEDYLAQLISYTAYTNDQSDGVKHKIENIIIKLNSELEKSKNN